MRMLPLQCRASRPSRRSVQLIRCDRGRCRKHRPGQPFATRRFPASQSDAANSVLWRCLLRCCTPDTESRTWAGSSRARDAATGGSSRRADRRRQRGPPDLDPFVGKWRGSTQPSAPVHRCPRSEKQSPSDHRRHRPCDRAQRRRRPRSCLTSRSGSAARLGRHRQ